MAMLRSAFMMNSVPGQVVCVGARGVYTSAMESVQSGTAKPATLRCISRRVGRERAVLSTVAKKAPSIKKPPGNKCSRGSLCPSGCENHQGLPIKVWPSQSEQFSGQRLFGRLNDRCGDFVRISVRGGSSVLQPSYPAVCMRRHRNPDRRPSV